MNILRNEKIRSRAQMATSVVVLLLAALWFTGCKSATRAVTGAFVSNGSASGLTEAELHDKLRAFYVQFANTIEKSTEAVAARTDDDALRERLIAGRLRVVRSCRQAVFQRNQLAAFIDTWSVCINLEEAMKSDDAKKQLGETQPIIADAATALRLNIQDLGTLFLDTNELAKVQASLEKFSREHPPTIKNDVVLPSSTTSSGMPEFGWVLTLPLTPFRAFEGVDSTAQAVHEMAYSAQDFVSVVNDMPQELSWTMELLMIQSRREITGMMKDIDAQQTNTQATLAQLHSSLVEVSNIMTQLGPVIGGSEQTVKAVGETSVSVNETLKTFTEMMKQLNPPPLPGAKPEEPKPPGKPFDILEYAKAAEQISVAAASLEKLVAEVNKTVGTNAITTRIQELGSTAEQTVSSSETSARKLTDHIAMRAIEVIAFLFITALGYTLAAAWFRRKLAAPAKSTPASG